jgi:homoserine dehydrogenase
MKPINVGLIGIGTVGGGTWTVLKRNAEEITRRAGRPIRITAVADRNVELAKQVTGGAARVTGDAFALVNDPEIDIIVELIGKHFDLRPKGIIQSLDLLRPIYRKTAAYGHFGRDEPEFTWEAIDKAATLRAEAGL